MLAHSFFAENTKDLGDVLSSKQEINHIALNQQRLKFFEQQRPEVHERFRFILSLLSHIGEQSLDVLGPEVKIGHKTKLKRTDLIDLQYCLRAFIPWKKGPYSFFGQRINSEWNSYLKWQKIKPFLGDIEGKTVADLGCHNGYFMFKMLALKPELVIGFDPVIKLFYNFQFMQSLIRTRRLVFEPLGIEHIKYFRGFFDRILCLGLLYHLKDPVSSLQEIHQSLRSGGKIIVDCQGIPGDGSYALFPAKKYAGASGVWFVPTKECVIHWMKRAQFKKIHCFYDETLQSHEQRASTWAPISSLKDYLNPKDLTKTIEGYPAPRRFYIEGSK